MADPSTNGDLNPSQNPNPASPPSPHSPSNQTRSPHSNRSRPTSTASPPSPHSPSNQTQSPRPNRSRPTPTASRKSERKRKLREFPEMSDPNRPHKTWSDADEVTLLRAAKEFRARTGSEPKIATMRVFFDKIKGLVAPHLNQDKAYYKLKRLKSKFLLTGSAVLSGAHERVLYDLSKDVWPGLDGNDKARQDAGDKDEGREYEEDGFGYAIVPIENAQKKAESYPLLSEALRDYWKSNGNNFSAVSLEKGLTEMDTAKATELEKKWKKQLEADMRFCMKRHDIVNEVYSLLIDCVKGQGS